MNEVIERAGTREPPWLKSYPAGIGWRFTSAPAPLWTLLDGAAGTFPDRPFVDFLDKAWTYAEVARLVDRAAAGFQRIGVRRGTRVGLLLPNCPYFVIAYFAVLKAGGTVVNYNPLYAPPEIGRQVVDSGTRIMVTLDLKQLVAKLDGLIGRTPLGTVVVARLADALPFPKNLLYPWVKRSEIARFDGGAGNLGFHELIREAALPEPAGVDPERDVAVLQYTGGTTGVPKAAALTHAALLSNTRQLIAWNRLARPEGERVLGVLPLFHVFALTVVLNYGTAVGAELVLLPRFDLAQVLRTIDRKQTTLMPGVPTLYAAISDHPALERFDLSSLRLCISGGAAMPLEVKERFEAATGCAVVEGYGLTESPVLTCNPIGGRHKPGSIGLPLPGTAIEVVSLEDRTTVLGPGETGEICVRAPQTMAGYLGSAGGEDDALRDGRLHTGDIGYLDDEGYGFVVDRLKDVIICGGFNVYPRTVEEALYQHPAVAEAAVVGVPDAYRGQTVKAYVVRRAGCQLDAPGLLDFLRQRISPIEMPKAVEFRDELPKSAIGKILKRELLDPGEVPADAGAVPA